MRNKDKDTKENEVRQISVAMKLNLEQNELIEQAMVKIRCFKKSTFFKEAGLKKAEVILKTSINHSEKSD